MFENPHFQRLREMFADQFEPDSAGFLYRKSMKSAPIRVTEAERDSFLAAFNRRLRYAVWSIVPATFLLIGLLVFLVPDANSASGQLAMYVGIVLILAPFLLVYYWAWNAPARELERRPLAGQARTPEEVRQIMFTKMTYKQLGFAAVFALLLVWKFSAKNDVFHGWNILWLVFAAALITAAGIQALRKWHYEHD